MDRLAGRSLSARPSRFARQIIGNGPGILLIHEDSCAIKLVIFYLPSVLLRCCSDQTGKTGWVRYRKFSKDLPVQDDTGHFESMHEFAVGQVIHPRSGINSGDPQAAKIPFFDFAVPVGIGKRPVDGIRSSPEELAVATAKPPGQF
jgi:hypothetical protein